MSKTFTQRFPQSEIHKRMMRGESIAAYRPPTNLPSPVTIIKPKHDAVVAEIIARCARIGSPLWQEQIDIIDEVLK
jgi:hypothetical protein